MSCPTTVACTCGDIEHAEVEPLQYRRMIERETDREREREMPPSFVSTWSNFESWKVDVANAPAPKAYHQVSRLDAFLIFGEGLSATIVKFLLPLTK